MSGQTYTGDVEVGGPADTRELPGLTITKLAVSEMANNAYLLRSTATGEALLVDAAADAPALLAMIGDADLRTVVTTHGHWDHHRALPDIVAATGAQTVAHAADSADLPVPVDRTVAPAEFGSPRPSSGYLLPNPVNPSGGPPSPPLWPLGSRHGFQPQATR